MVFDILNLIATSVLAFAAIRISTQANSIAKRSVRLEADKHIFEWGQRCLTCLSKISALRLSDEKTIDATEFKEQRRTLKAQLIALKEEGRLFFEKGGDEISEPATFTLERVQECLHGAKFKPPKADDYLETRKPQNDEIRQQTRLFIEAIQSRVGDEWLNR